MSEKINYFYKMETDSEENLTVKQTKQIIKRIRPTDKKKANINRSS